MSTARRLVQDFFLPAPVSEKAIQYLQFNERIEERIKRLSETCQRIFFERQLETNNEITRAVMQMEREVNGSLANIPEECFRVARHHLMREYGLHFERIVSENFSRMYGERGYSFHIEGDLISAITKAKAIETAVRYTLPK